MNNFTFHPVRSGSGEIVDVYETIGGNKVERVYVFEKFLSIFILNNDARIKIKLLKIIL